MSFKCFFNSHFVFVSQIHISFLQGSSFRFAVIMLEGYFLPLAGFFVCFQSIIYFKKYYCNSFI